GRPTGRDRWRRPSRPRPCPAGCRRRGAVRAVPARPRRRAWIRPADSWTTRWEASVSNLCSSLNIGKARRTLAVVKRVLWVGIALLGAAAFGVLALARGETINAAWLLVAAVCTYTIAFRFYSKFLANTVFGLDARRATPAERLNNGHDFVPTNRWVLFGHHFAAIAGAGPLVGPVLAAQFGFLPGTLWLVIGVVLGGAVQDFTILFCSLRRDGKSLGQMAKEEVSRVTGATAMVAVLAIMIILLAVLALIVVNAL